jgi:hypothetical protein
MTPDLSNGLSKAQGPGKVAMALFGTLAGMSLLMRGLALVGAGSIGRFYMPLKGLLTFVGVIFYLVWIYRVVTALGSSSKYSPGMSVGGWFIPFYNFIFPFLSLRDVWSKTMGPVNAWVPGVWWGTYFAAIIFNAVWGNPSIAVHLPSFMGQVGFAVNLVAFGTWAFAIQQIQSGKPAPQAVAA